MGSILCNLRTNNPELSLQSFLFYQLQTQQVVLAAVVFQEGAPCNFQQRA